MRSRLVAVRGVRVWLVALLAFAVWPIPACAQDDAGAQYDAGEPDLIQLPAVRLDGPVSVEEALSERRSIRNYGAGRLTLDELGQVLWSAQGITYPIEQTPEGFQREWRGGFRTAPSAGALYPLELYVVVGGVDGLEPGFYRYVPVEHALEPAAPGDLRAPLSQAAHGQTVISTPPAVLVIAGVVARTAAKYGERAEQYVLLEAGAAAENVFLQCESLGLATVIVGAFVDEQVKEVLQLPEEEETYVLMPIGRLRPTGSSPPAP
jgi:SagB-type dehydrogenase family enzyme